jgi:hypothetical protein
VSFFLDTAAATATKTSARTTTTVNHLSGSDKALTLALVVGFVLLAGAVVVTGRRVLEGPPRTSSSSRDGDTTLVRSWLAISLVGGLLIFVAISFWLDDTTLRSTLIGGVVANAGAAVAFYFASKSADQARSDILSASLPTTLVPDLMGKDLQAAQQAVASTPFRLEANPPKPPPDAQVVRQEPAASHAALAGTPIKATLAGPVPNLSDATLEQASAKLKAVGLQLDPSPAQPAPGTKVVDQDPPVGGAVPGDLKVRATFG